MSALLTLDERIKVEREEYNASASTTLTPDNPIVGVVMQNPTEDMVAEVFAQCYSGQFVFAHGENCWLRWDGRRWQVDELKTLSQMIRETARQHNSENKSQFARSGFYKGIASILASDHRMARRSIEFDKDNYLLNTPAGTYDLRSNELRPHDPLDKITMLTAVSPRPEGGERFLQFMDEITEGDNSLIDYLQVSLGSMLSGAVEEHWMVFWIGTGRNGKNTLADTIWALLGDYSGSLPGSALMSKAREDHPTEIMNLRGKRLVLTSEVKEGSHWEETRIKEITGDQVLKGRFMRSDWVEFPRTHKHLALGNYRPQLRNVDIAIRSRMKLVPFKACFVGREDPDLMQKLSNESPFILQWLLQGHQQWIENGKRLVECKAVEQESDEYFEDQASVSNWIRETCNVTKDDSRAVSRWHTVTYIYQRYVEWTSEQGIPPFAQPRFKEVLKNLTYVTKKSNGARIVGLDAKNWLGS